MGAYARITLVLLAMLCSPLCVPAAAGTVCDPTQPQNCLKPNSLGGLPNAPAAAGAGSLAPVVSAAAEASHVIKNSKSSFYDAYVTTAATSGFLLVLDAASDPGNGAVTPKHCVPAAANATTGWSSDGMPAELFASGVVVVFSTTGCFTETKSATAFFHARAN